tara:strand:- start:234 stop:656 length:423 start_codon:yes stop_codon:yes gene_type:complete
MNKFNIGNYKLPHMAPFKVKKLVEKKIEPIKRNLPNPPMQVPIPIRQNGEAISSTGVKNDSTAAVNAWNKFKASYMDRTEKMGKPITPEENLAEYNREKNEFYYDTNRNELRLVPTDDAEMKDQRFLDTLDSFQLPPQQQ